MLAIFVSCATVAQENEKAYSEEPTDYRLTDYRAPVPKSLSGATTLSTEDLEKILANSAEKLPLLLDVLPTSKKPKGWPEQQLWLPEPHATIPGAHWLPEVGFGTINQSVELAFKQFMRQMTHNNLEHPVVLFCHENCWISWNASKRLLQYGYQNIYWFPDGINGWINNLNDTVIVKAVQLK